ncbi:MAG: DNA repair protein RecO [Spirochaetia bacterium]|nr:DNA repair protein RecO [Spirochaetia bacterium]
MELKTEGLVLKRIHSRENDDVTFVFTRELGKVMVISRSTRKMRSKLRNALELFSLNTYFLVKSKKDSKYFTLVQAQHMSMFENMRLSLRKIGFSYLVMELLYKFTEIEDRHEELFDIAKDVLSTVDSGAYSNVENTESYFKLKLLHNTGFDLTSDSDYLRDKKATAVIKKTMEHIMACEDPRTLDVDYDTIRDINMLIDGYIIQVLGEDIFSNRILDGIKNAH